MFIEALEGLCYLQNLCIGHNDIKPGNLLILNKSLKIADLGEGTININATTIRPGVGTVWYMSPIVYKSYLNKI